MVRRERYNAEAVHTQCQQGYKAAKAYSADVPHTAEIPGLHKAFCRGQHKPVLKTGCGAVFRGIRQEERKLFQVLS